MYEYPVSNEQVFRSTQAVNRMLAEGRLAQAVSLLYCLHKNHIHEWVMVKRALLRFAKTQKSLQTIATVLDASKKSTLSESARIIPGLADFFHEDPLAELLD
jgi:hypothetical protein